MPIIIQKKYETAIIENDTNTIEQIKNSYHVEP